MSIIKVENLVKYYGDFPAVEGISFELKENEALGLLGLNGAGKTTVLRILSGFLIPSSGNVHIAGQNLAENPLEIKKELGYLPETPPLYKEQTVDEYLRYVGRLKGISEEDLDSAVNKSIALTDLKDVQNRLIGNLSLGYRKRVGIAQAVIHEPNVVILDEPISGLDPKQIIEMRALINDLKKQRSIIISSHILSEVSLTCDRFLIIHKGKIVSEESVSSLKARVGESESYLVAVEGSIANPSAVADGLASVAGVEKVVWAPGASGQELRVSASRNEKWKKAFIDKLFAEGLELKSFKPDTMEGESLESVFMGILN